MTAPKTRSLGQLYYDMDESAIDRFIATVNGVPHVSSATKTVPRPGRGIQECECDDKGQKILKGFSDGTSRGTS